VTVAELIVELSKLTQDARVVVEGFDGAGYDDATLSVVRLADGQTFYQNSHNGRYWDADGSESVGHPSFDAVLIGRW
jgi:hypothetical protein